MAAGVVMAPAIVEAQNMNEKLNIAIIGAGGRGAANAKAVASENIVALCDVNEVNLAQAAREYPKAKTYTDFRKLFETPEFFDAVVVSTCEHTHAMPTLMALKNKKHVFCEKPLTHDIYEARQIRLAAAEARVSTQMGIQIHATDNYRRVVELIQSEAIGKVNEVHVWVSRAWGWQSKEAAERNKDIVFVQDRPQESMPIPSGLHWDLWLGPAPERPFHDVYFPGPKWYRWWDFGNGTMSDLGSHFLDLPFWALKLKYPSSIESTGTEPHPEIAPATMKVKFEYQAMGDQSDVTVYWYQGEVKPEIWMKEGIPQWPNGILFIGDRGMLLSDYGKYMLLPEKSYEGYVPPDPFLPRIQSHHDEWLNACKSDTSPSANFEYSGWLTEANHLGNVAFRCQRRLEWDAEMLEAKGLPTADPLIRCNYRKGWSLDV